MSKGLTTLVRLHKWKLDEKRRELAELDRLVGQLRGEIVRLDSEIASEKALAGGNIEASLTFPAYAKAMRGRRSKLEESIARIDEQTERVTGELADIFQEVKRYEIAQNHRHQASLREGRRRERIALDEVALVRHGRNAAE